MFSFDLSQDIFAFLQKHPSTREMDIIRHLQSLGRLPEKALGEDLSLFRTHFLVFNALYRLQRSGQISKAYQLTISALSIELLPWQGQIATPHHEVKQQDPLYVFYTDWTQLNQTDSHDVQTLLTQFWQRFIAPELISHEDKTQALATLELMEPVDFETIKKQYRRLAMRHHPDRGGDSEKLVTINQAMQCLQSIYLL